MTSSSRIASNLLGLVGAAIGATVGYYTFRLIYDLSSHRLYGMMIPGAMLGLGCGALSRHPSTARGVLCAVAALALGVFVEWRFFPFIDDPGFRFFVSNLSELNTITIVMIVAGGFLAFLLGKDCATDYFGSIGAAGPRASKRPASHSD
jgi:hypothetical protein